MARDFKPQTLRYFSIFIGAPTNEKNPNLYFYLYISTYVLDSPPYQICRFYTVNLYMISYCYIWPLCTFSLCICTLSPTWFKRHCLIPCPAEFFVFANQYVWNAKFGKLYYSAVSVLFHSIFMIMHTMQCFWWAVPDRSDIPSYM